MAAEDDRPSLKESSGVDLVEQHLSDDVDYLAIMSSAVNKAAIRRTMGVTVQILFGIFVIAASMISAVLLTIAIGVVSVGPGGSDATADRYQILAQIPRWLAGISALTWLAFVLRAGYFLYDPSSALSGVRGDTRQWYDATTDALSENYSSVASGLARALNISLKSKIRATNLSIFSLLAMSLSVLCLLAIIFNGVLTKGFSAVVTSQVTEDLQAIQMLALDLLSGGRGSELISGGGVQPFTPPPIICWLMFALLPVFGLFVSYQIFRNAIDMRWSLLTSPDTVRRFMYMFVYRRNAGKDFLDEYAWKVAHRYFLQYALPYAPEDFIGMDGRLFFYGDDVLDEVEEFAKTRSPKGLN